MAGRPPHSTAGTTPTRTAADDPAPSTRSLATLASSAQACTACDLYRSATQAVFGAGPRRADIMLVGEQPGDREDLSGQPFVGPAGRLLDDALEDLGISRDELYVTNAVKHFRWKQGRGKRRIHQNPNLEQVRACRPWLDAELTIVAPKVVVVLGATAAKALLGPDFRVTRERGRVVRPEAAGLPAVVATVHPASIVRQHADPGAFEPAYRGFVDDLRVAVDFARRG